MWAKHHVLVVTRIFTPQSEALSDNDLKYSYIVLNTLDGFAFYNSDATAGSSQHHKHLQLIPYKSLSTPYLSKILQLVDGASASSQTKADPLGLLVLDFPFFEPYKHILVKFREFQPYTQDLDKYAAYLQQVYQRCRERVGCASIDHSFNLAFGKNWMLMVLRKKEKVAGGISVNGLGCLGSICVTNRQKFDRLKMMHPSEFYSEILVHKNDNFEYLVASDI